MPAIEAVKLERTFKGGVTAVGGVDLVIAPGEVYGFLGPNGAGKSTTVHMLTTLLPPTEGTARVAGFDIVRQGAEVRTKIGAARLGRDLAGNDAFDQAREIWSAAD